jgi:hypothetical protein
LKTDQARCRSGRARLDHDPSRREAGRAIIEVEDDGMGFQQSVRRADASGLSPTRERPSSTAAYQLTLNSEPARHQRTHRNGFVAAPEQITA